jgi:fumarylpyruvate hydrolase
MTREPGGASRVVQPPERPSLAVRGAKARFPVRRVYCVGRTYAAHRRDGPRP